MTSRSFTVSFQRQKKVREIEIEKKLGELGNLGESSMQGSRRDTINERPDPIGNEQEGGGIRIGEIRIEK